MVAPSASLPRLSSGCGFVLTFVAISRIDPVFFLQLVMGGGELVTKAEDGLRRIQTVGPDASEKAENKSA